MKLTIKCAVNSLESQLYLGHTLICTSRHVDPVWAEISSKSLQTVQVHEASLESWVAL